MRKYFTAFIGFGFLAIFITVICLVSFEPIDSLMKPPMSSGENHEIQLAFAESVDEPYKLRAPLSGDYRSSYVFSDLDGDNQEEVIVFYSTEDAVDIVKMSLLVKTDNAWKAVAKLESTYNEIQQVEFADIDSDGYMEVLVGWAVYQNDLSRNLNVYKVPTKNNEGFKDLFSCTYSDFEALDIDGDGVEDIAVFESINSSNAIKLTFNTFEDSSVTAKASIPLDSSVYSVFNLAYDNSTDIGHPRLFVDGYKIDAGIITECIYWDNENKILQKFKSDDNISVISSRMTNISCQDVNGDGLIDIPLEIPLKDSKVINENKAETDTQSIIKWIQLTLSDYKTVTYQLIYSNNDFRITFSEKWMQNITVTNNYSNNTIYFYSTEDKNNIILFELRYTSTQVEEDSLSNKYKLLTETGKGKLFYIIYNPDANLNINKIFIENTIVF